MALILKSNNISSNVLSDQHGVEGATDWAAMLDFENNKYLLRTGGAVQNKTLDYFLNVVRDTIGNVLTDEGYSTVGVNQPRLSKNLREDAFGLMVEGRSTNYFLDSNNPRTQTITLTPSGTLYMQARVKGAGSISISGTDIVDAIGAGTEDSPIYFKVVKSSGTSSFTVTVSGSLTYVSVENTFSGYHKRSEIRTGVSKNVGRGVDTITFNASALNNILTNKGNFTLLMQCVANDYIHQFHAGFTSPLVEVSNGTRHYAIARAANSGFPQELRYRVFDSNEKSIGIMSGIKKGSTIAVCVSNQGIRVAMDGKVADINTVMSGFTIADLKLGWSSWTGLEHRAEGCFTKLAIYDRVLTVSELAKVTQSF